MKAAPDKITDIQVDLVKIESHYSRNIEKLKELLERINVMSVKLDELNRK